MDDKPPARGLPKTEAPFVWQSCRALQLIRDRIGELTALAVYVGLTTIASEERKNPFEATVTRIARASVLRYRKTWDTLQKLQSIGVIGITKSSGQSSLYTLTTFARSAYPPMHQVQKTYARDDHRRVQTDLNRVLSEPLRKGSAEAVTPDSVPPSARATTDKGDNW